MTNRETSKARQRASNIRQKAMRDPVAHPCCFACGFSYPPIVHMHHIYPLSETQEPIDSFKWVCPNCHAMIHEIRRMYYSSKRPSNYQTRLAHLEYWLYEVCQQEVADKLREIAKATHS